MVRFITLAGQKQVGKDSSARIIQATLGCQSFWFDLKDEEIQINSAVLSSNDMYDKIHIVHFADSLKQACHIIFGIPLEDMETEEGKQKLTHVRWPDGYGVNTVSYSVNRDGEGVKGVIYKPSDNNRFMTVREVLQFVGTELFRNQMVADVWLESIFRKPWKEDDIVIIADARFPNEVAVAKEKGLLIGVSRNTGLESDGHASETSLADYDGYDHMVVNNGSVENLVDQLVAIMAQENASV